MDCTDRYRNIVKHFLWNGRQPKFMKEILKSLTNLGGLHFANLETFDVSLKLSSLRRILHQKLGLGGIPNRIQNTLTDTLWGYLCAKNLRTNKDMARSAHAFLKKNLQPQSIYIIRLYGTINVCLLHTEQKRLVY